MNPIPQIITISPFSNAKAMLAAQVIGSLLWLATISLLARRMVDVSLGQFLYAFAVATGFEAITDAGLRFVVVTKLAGTQLEQSRSSIFFGAILAKALLSIIASIFVVALVITGFIQSNSWIEIAVTIAVLITLPSTNPLVWVLRSGNMHWYESLALVLYRIVILSVVLLVTVSMLGVTGVLAILVLGNFAFLALIVRPALHVLGPLSKTSVGDSIASCLRLIQESIGYGSSLILSQFNARFWVLLLGYISFTRDLIALSTSQMIIQSVLMIGVALGASYLPHLVVLASTNSKELQRLAKSLILISLAIGMAFGLGVNYAAPVIMLKVFAQQGEQSTAVLRILAGLAPIILLSFVLRYVLSAVRQNQREFKATLYGIVPAILLSPLVVYWRDVRSVLFLYITGELITMAAKLLAVRRAVGIKLSEITIVCITTLSILATYALLIKPQLAVGSSNWLLVSGRAVVISVIVVAIYMLVHYRHLAPIWELNLTKQRK